MKHSISVLFVDRTKQASLFRRMLEGKTKRRIMLLPAEEGLGKTWLINVFAQEAKKLKLPLVHIDFAETSHHDTCSLVQYIVEMLDSEYFQYVNRVINELVTPQFNIRFEQNFELHTELLSDLVHRGIPLPSELHPFYSSGNAISFGENNRIEEVGTGDIAGHNLIKDNVFFANQSSQGSRKLTEGIVNAAFFHCLSELCQQNSVVFLFDTYEQLLSHGGNKISFSADRWVREQLLARIRDGRLTNVTVVISGRRVPILNESWNDIYGAIQLGSLGYDDVAEYLRVRQGLIDLPTETVKILHEAINGHPAILGLIGRNLCKHYKKEEATLDDNDW